MAYHDPSFDDVIAAFQPPIPIGWLMTYPRRQRSKHNVDTSPAGKAKRTYKGDLYDSQAECDRAKLLDLLIDAGEIVSWKRQVWFRLEANGILIKRHKVDFVITAADGSIYMEDVKGYDPYSSRLTHKIFAACYPGYDYRVMKRDRKGVWERVT